MTNGLAGVCSIRVVAGHATAITLRYPPKNIIINKLFSVLNLDIAFFRFALTNWSLTNWYR